MRLKAITGIVLIVLLVGMFTFAFIFDPIEAEPSPQQCPPGIVSYWKFDEGSGTTAYDSADANDGTLVNGPIWTTGQVDDALSFDGVDDYVSVSDDPSLRISEKITIEAWVNITDRSNFRAVVVKQGNYHFRIRDGYLGFIHWTSEGWKGGYDDTTLLDTDTWYHVAVSFDTVNDIIKFYVNGNNVKNITDGWYMATGDDPLTIGSQSPEALHRNFFNGIIDEVAVYNRILTLEEIRQHYENGLRGWGYCAILYAVTIEAYCYTEGTPVSVSIDMDGSPTSYTTPHTFTNLTGTHNFTVPYTDPHGCSFRVWYAFRYAGKTGTTITVDTGGNYTAYYSVHQPGCEDGGGGHTEGSVPPMLKRGE